MNHRLTNPGSAAVISFLLALPFAILFLLLVFHIEPPPGPLAPLLTMPADRPNILGTAIVLAAWGLSLAGFIINLRPIVRNVRAGNSLTAYPTNLLVGVTIFLFLIMFVGAIVVDQYPCWIGVPNCD